MNKELQTRVSDKLSKQIAKILGSPELHDLSEEQIKKLAKSLVIDNLKEQLKVEVKKATVDIENLKTRWIATFNSDLTKKNYKHNVEVFLSWLNNKSIIDVKPSDVDDYLLFLKNSAIKPGTIRFRIAAASSFYNYLLRNDIITNNYFIKVNGLPRITENLRRIPSKQDIEIIEAELMKELNAAGRGSIGKQRSARIMVVVLGIIKNHALRIGAFPSLTIDNQGRFIANSKADVVRGKLKFDCIELIKMFKLNQKQPFKDYNTTSLKKQFERFLGRLYRDGKIDHIYTPHDFRHFAAIRFYEQSLDIFASMKFLNHKHISTTQIYLKGLQVLE